jgi:predicted XRE-type DNA-binding protein
MARFTKSLSVNDDVFRAMGFAPVEARKLTARSALVDAISRTIERRRLSRTAAARLCGASRSFFYRVLRGHIDMVTIDLLTRWLMVLGHDVEFRVRSLQPRRTEGEILVISWGCTPLQSRPRRARRATV